MSSALANKVKLSLKHQVDFKGEHALHRSSTKTVSGTISFDIVAVEGGHVKYLNVGLPI